MIREALKLYAALLQKIHALYDVLNLTPNDHGDQLISLLTLEINLQGIILKLQETELQLMNEQDKKAYSVPVDMPEPNTSAE